MRITLANHYLKVVANTKGAELNSVKNEDHIEYLWQAHPRYWGWHAPILFPIVGRLINDRYQFDGRIYHMKQHGFARQCQFTVLKKTNRQVTFDLKATQETQAVYPFNFDLQVSYRLVAHTIQVNIQVTNLDSKQLWFSTGSHPGFNLPLRHNGSTFNDYHLTVAPKKIYQRIILKNALNDIHNPVKADMTKPLNLRHSLFNNDAFILSLHKRQTTLMISNSRDDNGVAVTVYNCPFVGVWSSYPQLGSFVCIEPWWGLADNVKHDGEFTHKTAINHLTPRHQFNARFDITIF